MDIYLFAGDSLTEGVYGESYVERIAKALHQGSYGLQGEVVNAGRGGDTVTAVVRRLDGPLRDYQPQWLILAVGTNDVWFPWLGAHSLGWRLWLNYRSLRFGQTATTDLDEFAAAYRALIDRGQQAGARVLACTVSPLGERLSSPVNGRAARLNGVIKHVAADCQVPVADVWQAWVEHLAALPSRSGYLPGEWLFAWSDRRRAHRVRPDEIAERRRLQLTFDGIHLNSRGADLWAETILNALVRAQATTGMSLSVLARRWDLPCFSQGPFEVCCSPGWEVRAHDLAQLLADAYGRLAARTGAQPAVGLAVLNGVHWKQSACSGPYPTPIASWNGHAGTVFVPDGYDDPFLRDSYLLETVAGWGWWPPDLAALGAPARATALADLLAIQELAHLFLQDLRVAPADPALHRLLTAYLTQVVLHALDEGGMGGVSGGLAAMWNAWGEVLARSGVEEGQVRLQAKALFQEQGDGLVASFAGHPATLEKTVTAALEAGPSQPVR
jgi:lysophospholipase L1-like esterase